MQSGRRVWMIGLVLLGVVVAILLGAFVLDDLFRPKVDTIPVSTSVAASSTATPTAVSSAPAPATPDLQVANSPEAKAIEAAYQRYQEVYSQAIYNLDTSHLSEVLDGQALQWVTDEVNGLKAKGWRARVITDDHAIAFGPITSDSATLVDRYANLSVYVDPNTGQDMPRTTPPTRIQQSVEFRKINGVWKIVGGTRTVLSEGQ